MARINSTNASEHSYPVYGRQFKSYRWYKPILVFILFAIIYLILGMILTFAVAAVSGVGLGGVTGETATNIFSDSYDDMDLANTWQNVVSLGSVALMIPALWLASKIVRDRPFSSYSSSRGGWSSKVFWRVFPIAFLCISAPILVDNLLIEHRLDDFQMKFTIGSLVVLTILGPLQCIAEEYAFRALLMQTFGSWFRIPVIAVILQSVVFVTMHPYDTLGKVEIFTKEEQKAENIRKILLAMSDDIRVIIIKLSDRLHNMRTLNFCSETKRRTIAHETMNIYSPIAHRLGISSIQNELEDLAFRYLDPFAYDEIEKQMALRKDARENLVREIVQTIRQRLAKDFDPVPCVEGRVKSNYGIYKKVFRDGKEIDQIYDRYAVRVIVNTVTECYSVLGIIHDMYRPIPARFKDYISTPKPNMYQSLHTTVIGRQAIPIEVQIRTWEMHQMAEYGIASHWKYKEGIKIGRAHV